jgi:methyl-accepting chemotaxis protein
MDEVTQQNSALVEENAAAAKALERQSQAMDQRVSFFRLDHARDDRASRPPVVARPLASKQAGEEMMGMERHKLKAGSRT